MAASRSALFSFLALSVAAALALAHHLATVIGAYVGDASSMTAGFAVAGGAAAAAALAARRRHGDVPVGVGFAVLAVLATVSAFVPFAAYTGGSWLTVSMWSVIVASASVTAAIGVALWCVEGRVALGLGLLTWSINPVRVLLLGLGAATFATAAAYTGLLRTGCIVGALLALCAASFSRARRYATGRQPPRLGARIGANVALAAATAGFVVADRWVAWSELLSYPTTIVHTADGDARRYVVTAGALGPELFVDHQLEVSAVDAHRYYESLTHPALATAPRARRVLLLEGGTGLAERELLRDSRVEMLTVVTTDKRIVDLSRDVDWLARAAEGALDSTRVEVVVAEPIVWLSMASERFDVVIADLPAPTGYQAGKHYTAHFMALLRERLETDGVAALPATSPTETPETYASIVATVTESGLHATPYEVPLPSMGSWSFVIATRSPVTPRISASADARFVTRDTLVVPGPADTTAEAASGATLAAQRVVSIFASERSAL